MCGLFVAFLGSSLHGDAFGVFFLSFSVFAMVDLMVAWSLSSLSFISSSSFFSTTVAPFIQNCPRVSLHSVSAFFIVARRALYVVDSLS